jgi:hypothetical protein
MVLTDLKRACPGIPISRPDVQMYMDKIKEKQLPYSMVNGDAIRYLPQKRKWAISINKEPQE